MAYYSAHYLEWIVMNFSEFIDYTCLRSYVILSVQRHHWGCLEFSGQWISAPLDWSVLGELAQLSRPPGLSNLCRNFAKYKGDLMSIHCACLWVPISAYAIDICGWDWEHIELCVFSYAFSCMYVSIQWDGSQHFHWFPLSSLSFTEFWWADHCVILMSDQSSCL